MAPGATSLGERQAGGGGAAELARRPQQDESGNRPAAERAKSNLAADDGQAAGDNNDNDDERKHFLARAEPKRGASLARQESQLEASEAWPEQNSPGRLDSKSKFRGNNEEKKAQEAAGQVRGILKKSDGGAKAKGQADAKSQKGQLQEADEEAARRKRKQAEAAAAGGARPCRARWLCCCCCCCCEMLALRGHRRCLVALLLLLIYSLAVYCLPFVHVQPALSKAPPAIPFNFHEGPLKASSASAYKATQLFRDQIHGPESLAFDGQANLYMAIEGGFVLYAHLNKSAPLKRAYLDGALASLPASGRLLAGGDQPAPELIKIAELNGLRPAGAQAGGRRAQRDSQRELAPPGWRRECQLDEQIYGPQLYTTTRREAGEIEEEAAAAEDSSQARGGHYYFKSKVRVSRCSKPLGIRLSPDESALYVIDTLSGLYRVNLRQTERAPALPAGQRQVSRLLDFRANQGRQLLPAVQLTAAPGGARVTRFMNVSLRAPDDLAIDFGAGVQGGDLIYLTLASQAWPAVSFVYDHLEGRPSGLVLLFDTGANQLAVLEPGQLAHVRSSNLTLEAQNQSRLVPTTSGGDFSLDDAAAEPYFQTPRAFLGAPRLDENDDFDDRPLNFPNGLELMDDRQALLIADTSNKRILKHWIRGPRRGTSDLWAWTPQFPDNIRRGYDKRAETYWVVGCGRAPKNSGGGGGGERAQLGAEMTQSQLFRKHQKLNEANWDVFALLHDWPMVRKFALKNIYLVGALVEFVGARLLKSVAVQDYGYELKLGSNLCAQGCLGMMALQYDRHGDIIRSVHSREFPNDLTYFSQVNELIDGQAAEHALYLGSPSYNYVTKLLLPAETRPLGPAGSGL